MLRLDLLSLHIAALSITPQRFLRIRVQWAPFHPLSWQIRLQVTSVHLIAGRL